jgi:hypothetical protein
VTPCSNPTIPGFLEQSINLVVSLRIFCTPITLNRCS